MVEALQAAGADVITLGMFNVGYSPAVVDWLRPGLQTRMGSWPSAPRPCPSA